MFFIFTLYSEYHNYLGEIMILKNIKFFSLLVLPVITLYLVGCGSLNQVERESSAPAELKQKQSDKNYPFIKLHTKEGNVYVLKEWQADSINQVITGKGKLLDANRELIKEDSFEIPYSAVVLTETNNKTGRSGTAGLTALTVLSGIGTVLCVTNPKACFGSCPTFYADNGNGFVIQAEGFSSSISPCLETTDIDALYNLKPSSSMLQLQLRNEAYETHVIRSADILAVPRSNNTRVFSIPGGKFAEASNIKEASEARHNGKDISEKLCSFDGREWCSPADSFDLAAKENIDLTFRNVVKGKKGIVISEKHTLLTTFLIYQSLSYMGTNAVDWLARLENADNNLQKQVNNPGLLLGYIEVYVMDESGNWIKAGEAGETGPIAQDTKIVPFEVKSDREELKIRIQLTKGLWRLDYIALADINKEVEPVLIRPSEAYPKKSGGEKITDLLTDSTKVLVSLPGDKYFIHYRLPDNYNDYEYFLQSRGYYLEWMRDEWIAEENPHKVAQLLLNPKQYLKDLAPQFKKIEADMEETFRSSKYVNP
jgi:hypothetical protein